MKQFRQKAAAYTFAALLVTGLAVPLVLTQTSNAVLARDGNPESAALVPPSACTEVIRKAYQNIDNKCTKLGRNKICYASPAIDVEAQLGVSGLTFSKPGDVTDAQNVRALKLGGYNPDTRAWGAAQLNLQANLPDSAADQYITMLALGDVEITDNTQAASEALGVSISASRTAYAPTISAADAALAPTQQVRNTQVVEDDRAFNTQVYSTRNAQSTQDRATLVAENTAQAAKTQARATLENATIQAFLAGQNQTAQARSTMQGATAQAKATAQFGALYAQGTAQDATTWAQSTLAQDARVAQGTIVAATSQARDTKVYQTSSAPLPLPTYKTLQAITLKTAPNTVPCSDSPQSGLLIQVPTSEQIIQLIIDDATLSLSSTVFVTAEPSGSLSIYTIDGSSGVTAFGVSQAALDGMVIRVPLDASLKVSGPPAAAVAYNADDLRRLPLKSLPRRIAVSSPRQQLEPGSLSSAALGNACLSPASGTSSTSNPGDLALPVGGAWKASAGTTATFTVGGDIQVQGFWKNYIALAPAGSGYARAVEPSAFAVSGGSTTLTYTFTKDIREFYVLVGVSAPGKVTLSVTCSIPPTPMPTETSTASPTVTDTPTRTPRPVKPSPTPSATASTTSSETDTNTPTEPPSPTVTLEPTDTDTPTTAASATNTDTATATPSATGTPSPTKTGLILIFAP